MNFPLRLSRPACQPGEHALDHTETAPADETILDLLLRSAGFVTWFNVTLWPSSGVIQSSEMEICVRRMKGCRAGLHPLPHTDPQTLPRTGERRNPAALPPCAGGQYECPSSYKTTVRRIPRRH